MDHRVRIKGCTHKGNVVIVSGEMDEFVPFSRDVAPYPAHLHRLVQAQRREFAALALLVPCGEIVDLGGRPCSITGVEITLCRGRSVRCFVHGSINPLVRHAYGNVVGMTLLCALRTVDMR